MVNDDHLDMEPLNIAFYVTGHGLGHATRAVEVCRALVDIGHSVTVVTGAPAGFFIRELPSPRMAIRKAQLDFGAKQRDAFSVDMAASMEGYHRIAGGEQRATLLETEHAWLAATKPDLVVSDIVPLACTAAAGAGIPCVCISNFSWDFIYSEYLMNGHSAYQGMVWHIAEDYAAADLLLRLPGHCPMPAFREVEDVPLVVRRARKSRQQVFEDLGLSLKQRMVVFIYGGQPPGDWHLQEENLPKGWVCVVCAAGSPPGGRQLPGNFLLAPADAYTPDLIAAADCLLGKVGYGTTSECLAHGTPIVFVRRDYFNEEPFLRRLLQLHGAAVEIRRRDFLEGTWAPFLLHAASLDVSYDAPTNGAEVAALKLQDHARRHAHALASTSAPPSPLSPAAGARFGSRGSAGSTRLRDAIVWGYMMQRHGARSMVEVPEWYTAGQLPEAPDSAAGAAACSTAGLQLPQPPGTPDLAPDGLPRSLQQWEVLSGGGALAQCPDTVDFLLDLLRLDDAPPLPCSAAPNEADANSRSLRELPERSAARGLFRWGEEVWVARAPGRLDVMGGIADYSGSLVLQLPLAQATHAAVQRHPLQRQPLWRHMRARHASAGGPRPALRVVSLGADAANRGPSFDLDLAELQGADGSPIPYEEARAYFKRDPAHSWAAYVAGALVVLAHEAGARFADGLSVLVSSGVPEGKGVSSSAALEVAVMAALAAAHGIDLDGRSLALLCQKVENCVVGAPCGVMDQMASALGQAGSLLAMRCQPAEVLPPVALPRHIRLWGVDSGIRHSVGGLDYSTVRTAAFMGLRLLSETADELQRQGSHRLPPQPPLRKPEGGACNGGPPLPPPPPPPIGGGYLANLSPSEFAQHYEEELPEQMSGADFLAECGTHWDIATQVDASKCYPVRQAAAHPVLENWRCTTFRQLLALPQGDPNQMRMLGELMLQSHASYSRCGLGSHGTDRIVALVRAEAAAAVSRGEEPALYGAKITGGGSGGTVCVLGRAAEESEAALARVVDSYAKSIGGYRAQVFTGSSPGAAHFGVLRLRRRPPHEPQGVPA